MSEEFKDVLHLFWEYLPTLHKGIILLLGHALSSFLFYTYSTLSSFLFWLFYIHIQIASMILLWISPNGAVCVLSLMSNCGYFVWLRRPRAFWTALKCSFQPIFFARTYTLFHATDHVPCKASLHQHHDDFSRLQNTHSRKVGMDQYMFGCAILFVLKLPSKITYALVDTVYNDMQEHFSGWKDAFKACKVY